MPMTPSSNSLSMRARGIFACSSISRTSGRISRFRELADAVAEEPLRPPPARSGVGRAPSSVRPWTSNVIIGLCGNMHGSSRPAALVFGLSGGISRPGPGRSTAAASAGHPQRHQLRQRRRHRHRQENRRGGPGHEAGRLRGARGPQAAESRHLRDRQDRRAHQRRDHAQGDPQHASTRRTRRGSRTSGCSSCCSTTTTCAAATTSPSRSR